MLNPKKVVRIGGLGMCEHCRTLFTIEDFPPEAMNAEWKCPKCKGVLTGKSFGYNSKSKKVKWVGPGKKWVKAEPKRDFELGNWSVITGRIPMI
ncbi:MAG: hypothetical protein ABSF47_03940 [Minisyncoccia bacterium]|jgi:hypothetical protein